MLKGLAFAGHIRWQFNTPHLGLFLICRKAFAFSKTKTLHHNLYHFASSKDSKIKDVCKAYHQDFILVINDLRSLLSNFDLLKSSLSNSISELQSVACPLLSSLDAFVKTQNFLKNLNLAINSACIYVKLMEVYSRTNHHFTNDNFYMVLKWVDTIEIKYLDKMAISTLKKMLGKNIAKIQSYIERKVNKEFRDWLVDIWVVTHNLGQLVIGQASSTRQREEDLRIKQCQVRNRVDSA
ncbi:Exocyst complex component SEC15B [Spatholobus suberectus]|nr:Exocyst complex component SEC15B [Spatholobus suberectus]